MIELGLELFVARIGLLLFLLLLRARFGRKFFENRIRLHFLLNEITQLKQRGLQDQKALLQLRGKDLLQREILRLMHSLAGHVRSLPIASTRGKQFTRRTSLSR